MAAQPDFVTLASIGTFAVATTGVTFVTAATRRALGTNTLLVPFIFSFIISFALAGSQSLLDSLLGWIVAVVNGAMLFCAATGANELATPTPAGQAKQHGKGPKV